MKTNLIACLTVSFLTSLSASFAQKQTVYAEAGLGWGQTLFFGDMDAKLTAAYGGTFKPNIGNNLHTSFYVSPDSWKGLGVGSRLKGTFGTSVQGSGGDAYIFNYYNVAASAKYFFLSQKFNRGLYARGSFGFGQMTTKRMNEAAKRYLHQYAIGTTATLSAGYVFPLKNSKGIGIEVEYETSNRNGTINGLSDGQIFKSGQIGGNIYFSF